MTLNDFLKRVDIEKDGDKIILWCEYVSTRDGRVMSWDNLRIENGDFDIRLSVSGNWKYYDNESMSKKEKVKLTKIYKELLEKQSIGGDFIENYTNGYRLGNLNGKIEILEDILGVNTGLVSEDNQQTITNIS